MSEQNELAKQCTISGVFMQVYGQGVVIRGESRVGKSELALHLINHGHRLIADDAIQFKYLEDDRVMGSCPEVLQDLLEVRGLGILDIRAMFGDVAIVREHKVNLVIELLLMDDKALAAIDRLHGIKSEFAILGKNFPQVGLPVRAGRNLAILVEGAVRMYLLAQKGYDAADIFLNRQRAMIAAKDQSAP